MKPIFLFLFFISHLTGILAQNNKPDGLLKNDFNIRNQTDSSLYFVISPKFKPDTVLHNFEYSQRYHGDPFQFNKPDSILLTENSPAFELRMPVVGGAYHIKMPVAVPDSTVQYYILEKRIQFYNPLEQHHR